MKYREIIERLKALSNPEKIEAMPRFGVFTRKTFGVSVPNLRSLAKQIGRDHQVAARLWASGIHDARILAALVDDPDLVTQEQMEKWVLDIQSWDVCDAICCCLFDRTPFAYTKAVRWSRRKEEYVKRAGFVLMAGLAVHDKEAADEKFLRFLPIIRRESKDERNFVRKAVNWALRQVGKRNIELNRAAIETAREIRLIDSRSARWIATDALRELASEAVQARLLGK